LSAMASRSTVTISAARLSGRMPGAMPRHPISHAAMHLARPSIVVAGAILGRRVNAPEPETVRQRLRLPSSWLVPCQVSSGQGPIPPSPSACPCSQFPIPSLWLQRRSGSGQSGQVSIRGRSGLNLKILLGRLGSQRPCQLL
jgi:hypothetical protein